MKITIEFESAEQLHDLLAMFERALLNRAQDKDLERHLNYHNEVAEAFKKQYRRGTCRKCGGKLAKGSRSYCREHETERVREWRRKKG